VAITTWGWVYLAVAIVFAVAGPTWPLVRKHPRLPKVLVEKSIDAAQDPKNWVFVLIILFIYSSAPPWIIRTFHRNDVVDITHRIFVEITPKQMTEFYEGRTGIEGDRLLEPYLGKWTTVVGTIGDIYGMPAVPAVGPTIVLAEEDPEKPSLDYATLNFSPSWSGRVATLHKGQKVTVVCTIAGAQRITANFNNCELRIPVTVHLTTDSNHMRASPRQSALSSAAPAPAPLALPTPPLGPAAPRG
jgi:hypothetical protein